MEINGRMEFLRVTCWSFVEIAIVTCCHRKVTFENPEGLKNREKDSKEKPCWRKVYFLDIVTLPQNTIWEISTATHGDAVVTESILRKWFCKHISNLILRVYGVNFDEPLSNMLTEMMITYNDVFCSWTEFW